MIPKSMPKWLGFGSLVGVRVTVDGVGRMVIPKSVRTQLGLGRRAELELTLDGGGLRLDPVASRDRGVGERDGFPILERVDGVVLTDEDVRRMRDDLAR